MTIANSVINRTRISGLDALRASMMLLGVVIHASASYMPTPPSPDWGFRDTATSPLLMHLALFIHIFRMPTFYLVAGFFAAMLLGRGSVRDFLHNRGKRIVIPLVCGWAVLFPLTNLGFQHAVTGHWTLRSDLYTIGWTTPGVLIHLWFLYFLLFMYGVTLAVHKAVPDLGLGRLVRWSMASHWRLLLLSLPSMLMMLPIGYLATPMALAPNWKTLAAYGYCFFVGWHCFALRHELAGYLRAWPHYLVLGVIASAMNQTALLRLRAGDTSPWIFVVSSLAAGLAMWGMVLGVLGFFLNRWKIKHLALDYIVDASYWIYLIHVPIITLGMGLLKNLPWSVWTKFSAINLLALGLSLASYELMVRYTFIGRILHGARERPSDGSKAGVADSRLTPLVSGANPRA